MLSRMRELAAEAENSADQVRPFDEFEEEAMVGLALDMPEYFQSIADILDHRLFSRVEVQYIMSYLLDYHANHNMIPTRAMTRAQLTKGITVDETGWQDVVKILDKPTDPRDIPGIKATLHAWARKKSYGKLFEAEALQAYSRGDYDKLEEIVNKANRIVETSARGFWLYEQAEELFQPDRTPHISTGFPQLDRELSNGGPSPGEVVCWLAATGVGKSILLCNNAINQSLIGNNVILITFELDVTKTALRCLSVLTGAGEKEFLPDTDANEQIKQVIKNKQLSVRDKLHKTKNSGAGQVYIVELPPDECSVNHIYAEIHQLKRNKGWTPKSLVLDYLELMVGRRESDNKDDYTKQKQVANQVRGLARNENVLVFTATQGNRSANDTSQNIDLNKIAESYGKSMSMDYVISLNQTPQEYDNNIIRMWIAKNRNGKKNVSITCSINYNNKQVRETVGQAF